MHSSKRNRLGQAVRLSDNVTIFAAELSAIKLTSTEINSNTAVTIFSDSLSSINALESGKSKCRPNLLNEILELLTQIPNKIVLVWVPSHIGIQGNEAADQLANSGISKPVIDVAVPLELGEAIQLADSYIANKWQEQWDAGDTGRQL